VCLSFSPIVRFFLLHHVLLHDAGVHLVIGVTILRLAAAAAPAYFAHTGPSIAAQYTGARALPPRGPAFRGNLRVTRHGYGSFFLQRLSSASPGPGRTRVWPPPPRASASHAEAQVGTNDVKWWTSMKRKEEDREEGPATDCRPPPQTTLSSCGPALP
jgi:hypothetical protein